MSNNLSKLLVSAGVDLLVERAFRGHELLEGPLFDNVPRIQVDDVVGGLQVAEVVGDANRRRVLGELVESAADIFDVREPDASPAPSSRSRNLTERPLLWLLEE